MGLFSGRARLPHGSTGHPRPGCGQAGGQDRGVGKTGVWAGEGRKREAPGVDARSGS